MEQSSAKGNKRIKLWLFSCEESKLIKLTSFLLYMLSVDALENNSLYGEEGWRMDNIAYCYILPQYYWQTVYHQQLIGCHISCLRCTFIYLQLSLPDIYFLHRFPECLMETFAILLYCETRFNSWKADKSMMWEGPCKTIHFVKLVFIMH